VAQPLILGDAIELPDPVVELRESARIALVCIARMR
jgi:hypothetical protein